MPGGLSVCGPHLHSWAPGAACSEAGGLGTKISLITCDSGSAPVTLSPQNPDPGQLGIPDGAHGVMCAFEEARSASACPSVQRGGLSACAAGFMVNAALP